MKWQIKQKTEPKFGDERILEKFLIFPKRINDEIRWLEIVKIHQVYTLKIVKDEDEFGWENKKVYYWADVKFIDNEEN